MLNDFLRSGTIITVDQETILIGWGKKTAPKDQQPQFYFPDFFLHQSHQWFSHESWEVLTISELLQRITVKPVPEIRWSCGHHQLFHHAFQDLQNRFSSQELQKAVPYVFEESPLKMVPEQLEASLASVLRCGQSNKIYLYGTWDFSEGILGGTPEILFRMNDSTIETMACAGTQASAALLEDDKEHHEHQLVVDGIVESLSPYGKVSIEKQCVLKLPNLSHLLTPIKVSLKQPVSFESVMRALHPTPALGAFPRKPGIQWLKNYQHLLNRNRFGAPVGFIFKEREISNCYVAIRNVQWNDEGMKIGAGCGIVAESQIDNEWKEIRLKIHAMKEMLAL